MGSTISEMTAKGESGRNCFGILPILPGSQVAKWEVIPPIQQSGNEDEGDKGENQDVKDDVGGGGRESRSGADKRPIAESSRSRSETPQSVSKLLDEIGVPRDEFFLMDPRCLHDPVGKAMASGSWERPTKRPKPVYPPGVLKTSDEAIVVEDTTSSRTNNSPEDDTGECSSSSNIKTFKAKLRLGGEIVIRAPESPFEVDKTLFIPISDSEGDDESTASSSGNEDALPQLPTLPTLSPRNSRSQQVQCTVDSRSIPLPSLTLRPRKPPSSHFPTTVL